MPTCSRNTLPKRRCDSPVSRHASATRPICGTRVEWSRVAADCGFYDQPHLVREFREFAGMTPSAYVAARGEYVNHVPLADA